MDNMNKTNVFVGIFLTAAAALLATGLFLIGNQHKAFRRHLQIYTEFANVDGIAKGAKVRVDGLDGGQVQAIEIPSKPSSKFRLKIQVDDRLHGLIRDDSIVTVETEGIVGDKYLLIHEGDDQSPAAKENSTLRSKEPFQISKVLEQASGVITEANKTMVEVRGRLDGALQAVTTTVDNTNGIVTDIRRGRGTAGVLLEDPATADNVKHVVVTGRQATDNLNAATVRVNDLLQDFQSRQLFAKAQQTLNNANGAAQQLNQTSQNVNRTVTRAFAEDQYGEDAGANLQQTLTNINQATGNLADDTAALKQEFFFRGFFKKRGYDDLNHLPVSQYRDGELFKKLSERRQWLAASDLFAMDANGKEVLSPEGRSQIDQTVASLQGLYSTPFIVEGYSQAGSAADQLLRSRARATLVRAYLELHFHLEPKNVGVIALSQEPPKNSGKSVWDGVCLVQLSQRR